jgi:hypothetical protein
MDTLEVCSPEPIDGLSVIADGEQVDLVNKGTQNGPLQWVRVLCFINEQMIHL